MPEGIDLARLKELAEKARKTTCQPWIKKGPFKIVDPDGCEIADVSSSFSTEYIAAASQDVMLSMIERIERLEEDFDAAARSAADESVKAVQLEEEAQFLAIRCERLCNAVTCCDDCPYQDESCPEQTIEAIDGAGWRKKARRFVEEAHADEV